MTRGAVILAAGLIFGLCAYCGLYFAGTASHRALMQEDAPELFWLKKEFNLSDAEFRRITELHAGYLPQCAAMCQRIDAKNTELQELLSRTDGLTPEIEAKLAEAGQLRVECQKNMLRHFLEVSRSMPPSQGKRYLEWVQGMTFLPEHAKHVHGAATDATHEHGSR
jgi:hypothetical protein